MLSVRLCSSLRGPRELNALLDLGCLTGALSEIIEFSARNLTAADDLDLFDLGAVYGEGSFHADTLADSSYGEGFSESAVLTRDNDALVSLDSFFVSFDNLEVNSYGVADFELRNVFPQTFLFDSFNDIHN